MMKFQALILLIIVFFSNNKIFSQLYNWDNNFGNRGVKKIILERRNTRGQKILTLDDGSIIVGVNSETPRFGALFNRDFYIYKLDNNGNLDLSFGTNGYYHQAFGGNNQNVTYLFSMAYDNSKNAIYIVSKIDGENKLFRISTDGVLDTSFGVNGYLSLDNLFNRIAIQNNGKIILTGYEIVNRTYLYYKIKRILYDGNIDSTFGVNGQVVLAPTQYVNNIISQVQLQTDGKIVTVGYSFTGNDGTSKAVISRFNTDGSLDTTFKNSGIIITNIGYQNTGKFFDLDINANGDIIVAGSIYYTGGTGGWYGTKPVLVKYLQNGQLDVSFGNNGIKVFQPIFGANDCFRSVIFTNDSKIVAGGNSGRFFPNSQTYYYLRMVDEEGTPNPDFLNSGFLTTNFGDSSTNYVFDINKNNNGDIISTGIAKDETGRFFQAVVCKFAWTTLSVNAYDGINNLEVFPNPINNRLFINSNNIIKEINIYSVLGSLLLKKQITNLSHKIDMEINFPKGVYFLEVIGINNSRNIKRIVKK